MSDELPEELLDPLFVDLEEEPLFDEPDLEDELPDLEELDFEDPDLDPLPDLEEPPPEELPPEEALSPPLAADFLCSLTVAAARE